MTDFNLLDMFSSDMDFEQAYSMYNNIQQNKVMGSFEELNKVQMLNQQYTPSLAKPADYAYGRQQILNGMHQDELDHFFTDNESNTLEKFLDNLANSTTSNPLQFYKNHHNYSHSPEEYSDLDFNFEMHTMKIPKAEEHLNLKKELTEAFTNPSQSIKYNQLITPPTSGDEGRKRSSDDEDSGEENSPVKKRKRSSTKPLLSLEQKRLNHSHSEQKRRQLCKLAYQRCLELIIDIDAFNKLPELNEAERKSKRARINKDGLPNLSKHNALIRISNEMSLIKSMNEGLKALINEL